jgi:hypothetical protein
VVIGRAAHEAIGFDKDALNRSMKMSVPTMGPTTDFKHCKRNFLNFLSIKAAYLIPLSERLDSWSFARSLSLLENLMVKQRPGQSLSDFVHYMRQTFDNYNETC